nr:hypothetical protein [Tanacetum cinerariifolium]
FASGKVPPEKARKYKKVASPSRKLSPVKEAKPFKKAKRVKRPTKKSATALIAGVVIGALLEASQVKEALHKSKKDSHMLHASSLGDEVGSQPKVLDESKYKTTGTDKGTEHDEEYESDDDNENVFEEEDDDLYKDVDVRSLGAEHEKERTSDEEMTDAD